MGKGYAEGPAAEAAAEERERRAERAKATVRTAPRRLVFGSTKDRPESHELGLADEVDMDALFASGAAWGLHVRSVAAR